MSILDIQKRTRRLGEIRLGTKGPKGNPVKLKTLRLTSVSKGLLEQAAALWGGKIEPWENKYSLVTESSEIPVVVPPQDPTSISWYELWTAGGLQRRCDGEQMILGDAPSKCLCDPDDRECKPHTRVQFMLPDIEDVGVWVLGSTGYYAAAELGAAMDLLLRQMADTGWMPQAILAVEERTIKRPGQPINRFIVPTLRLQTKLSDLLPAGGPPTPALEAGTDTEDDEGSGPTPSSPTPAPVVAPEPEPEEAELVGAEDVEVVELEDLEAESRQWAELWALVEEDPIEGNMSVISDRVRRLYALMEACRFDKWGDRGLHAALKKKYNAKHLGDLRRESLEVFTTSSFLAARGRIGDKNETSE